MLYNEPVKATPVQTVAFDAKCKHKRALFVDVLLILGTVFWAHSWAHTARFSLGLFRKRKENEPRRRFFRPPPSTDSAENLAFFAMRTHGLWAHSRKGIEIPGRADGARCASYGSPVSDECR